MDSIIEIFGPPLMLIGPNIFWILSFVNNKGRRTPFILKNLIGSIITGLVIGYFSFVYTIENDSFGFVANSSGTYKDLGYLLFGFAVAACIYFIWSIIVFMDIKKNKG